VLRKFSQLEIGRFSFRKFVRDLLTSDDVIIYIISDNVTPAETVNLCEHFKTKLARIGTGITKL